MDRETHDLNQLWTLIRDIRFAMMTTRDAGSRLHTRPLTTQNRDEEQGDALWFFVSRGSEACQELQADAQVSVAYADPANTS
jgi:general stress protein 26